MSIASDWGEYDPDNVIVDREEWEIHFQDILEKSPEAAEGFARVLFYLLQAVENGPEGLAQASNSLRDGIEWAYLYTDAHKSALKLFLFYIEGKLMDPDGPEQLIGGAVVRATAAARKSRTRLRSKPERSLSQKKRG